jgi:hypothetical protein
MDRRSFLHSVGAIAGTLAYPFNFASKFGPAQILMDYGNAKSITVLTRVSFNSVTGEMDLSYREVHPIDFIETKLILR